MIQQCVGHMMEKRCGCIAQMVRAVARYAIGPRFDSSFSHFLLLRSVVILSRWADVGCEIFPSLTGREIDFRRFSRLRREKYSA